MRTAYTLVAVAALTQAGCSCWVANSGAYLGMLSNRGEARTALGQPHTITEATPGTTDETFLTRRKMSKSGMGCFLVLHDWRMLGLDEVYLFPRELFIASRRSVVGQRIEVEYDDSGRVARICHDCVPVFRPLSTTELDAALTRTGTARFARLP